MNTQLLYKRNVKEELSRELSKNEKLWKRKAKFKLWNIMRRQAQGHQVLSPTGEQMAVTQLYKGKDPSFFFLKMQMFCCLFWKDSPHTVFKFLSPPTNRQ